MLKRGGFSTYWMLVWSLPPLASCTNARDDQTAHTGMPLTAPAVYTVANGNSAEGCRARAAAAVRAASHQTVSLDRAEEENASGEAVRYASGAYSVTCVLASGWTVLLDSDNFARYRAGASEPNQQSVDAVTRDALGALEADGLIDGGQLDWANAHYSATEARGGEGFGQPEVGPFHVQTKITVPRKIDGIPVVGNGVKITVDATLRVVGIALFWRALDKAETTAPVVRNMGNALSALVARDSIGADQVQRYVFTVGAGRWVG